MPESVRTATIKTSGVSRVLVAPSGTRVTARSIGEELQDRTNHMQTNRATNHRFK